MQQLCTSPLCFDSCRFKPLPLLNTQSALIGQLTHARLSQQRLPSLSNLLCRIFVYVSLFLFTSLCFLVGIFLFTFSFHISFFANVSIFFNLFFFHVSLLPFLFRCLFCFTFICFCLPRFVFVYVSLFLFTCLCFARHISACPSLSVTSSDSAQSVQASRLTFTFLSFLLLPCIFVFFVTSLPCF